MTTRKRSILLAALVALILPLGGCHYIKDGVSWALGLPAESEIQAVKDQLSAKDQELIAIEAEKQRAEKAASNAERSAEKAEALRLSAQATAAEIAQQMANAGDDPVRYQSLVAAFKGAQAQVEKYAGVAAEASALAASFHDQVAQYESQAAELDQRIRALEMELEGIDAERAQKFAALGLSINTLGQQAQALGVPGAEAAAQKTADTVEAVLGVIFGGAGATGLTAFVAKRRRERDQRELFREINDRETEAQEQRRRAEAALEVIATTEEFDLIKDDPVAKEAARLKLSDDAREALGQGKAKASPRRAALVQSAAA